MNNVNVPSKRSVGFLLGIGILFFPIVFAWFLLRNGHSVLSRVVGFGWLILCTLVIVAAPPAPPTIGSRSVSTATSAASSAPAEPLKTYTSTQVAKSYDDNTVAADALFKGKRVKVTGRVTDINTDFRGNPYLVLAGSNQFLGPQFKFDKSSISVMATLKKGVTVSVVCTGAGDVIKTPMFEDCEMSK